jgi:hypothetical protein
MVAGGVSSCRVVSQLDDDVFPPSNSCLALLLATTADLLLDGTASVTLFTRFRGGPVFLSAVYRWFTADPKYVDYTFYLVSL